MTARFSLRDTAELYPYFDPLRTDKKSGKDFLLPADAVMAPSPTERIPIGTYNYYPQVGLFAPEFVGWRDEPEHPGRLREFKAQPFKNFALGIWGIRHLTQDESAYRQLGVIVESVLAGEKHPTIMPMVEKLSDTIFGGAVPNPAQPQPATPDVRFFYPPLIHILHIAGMEKSSQQADILAATMASAPDAPPVGPTDFPLVMSGLLLDPGSPLYGDLGVASESNPVTLSGHGDFDGPHTMYGMSFSKNPGSVWAQRMEKAGVTVLGATSTSWSPNVFTALTLTNSIRDMDTKTAAKLGLIEVLARSPNTTYFNPHQEFPFDIKDRKDPIASAAVEALLDPDKPDEISGPIGRVLLAKVSKRTIRSESFAQALEEASEPDWTPPKIASVVRSMKKLTALFGKLEA